MDGEVEMIQCYFDHSHMIYRSRYPYHYQRCSRQHPHMKHRLCPYDGTHIMHPDVYDAHLLKCETRPLEQPTEPPVTQQPTVALSAWEEGENTWATEEAVVPQNTQSNYFVSTLLIGASRAERRQHRHDERIQCNESENSRQASEAQSNNDKKKKKKKKKKNNNSKSNSENVNNSTGNNPVPTKVGKAPLSEQKSISPDSLNIDKLSIRD